jgi:hypothetical protein
VLSQRLHQPGARDWLLRTTMVNLARCDGRAKLVPLSVEAIDTILRDSTQPRAQGQLAMSLN